MSEDKRLSGLKNTLTSVAGVVEQLANRLKDLNSQISQLAGNSSKLGKAQQKVAVETKKAAQATNSQAVATEKANKANKGFFSNLGKNIGTIVSFYGAYQVLNLGLSTFIELTVGSAKRAIALEKSLADLRAVAGLTADDISRLRDVVFEVAGATSLTATEIVELQKQLAKLGSSTEEIENLTKPIALLSQALGEDAGGVAATLKKTLNQFQATSEEADKFANILTGAVNETALSMNDLGTALGYVGPLGAQLGVSFEETAALLGILADNGFKASKAGTGLRNFFVAAAKDGRPFNEFLDDVADRNLTAAENFQVFGKVGASQARVLSENVERYKELSEELSRSGRLFEANAIQMSSTQGQLDLLSSAYDKFSTRLGESFIQTKIFINLIAVLDKQASGLAGAYRILANQTEDTKNLTDELIESFRKFEKGEDSPISQSEALGRALRVVGEEGEFSKSTIDETYSLLMFYLKQGKDLQEAFAIASEKTGRGQLRLLTTTKELVELMYQQSKGIDEAYIAQEANNEVVKRYKQEYMELQALTRSGIKVDREKQKLQEQINIDIARYTGEIQGLKSIGITRDLTNEEKERLQVLEKRIALLNSESEAIGELKVSDETLASKRKAADKDAEDRRKKEFEARTKEIQAILDSEIDAIEAVTNVELTGASSAEQAAQIRLKQEMLVQAAYANSVLSVQALKGEYIEFGDQIDDLSDKYTKFSDFTQSAIGKEGIEILENYKKEFQDLGTQLKSGEITLGEFEKREDELEASLISSITTLKNSTGATEELKDMLDKVVVSYLNAKDGAEAYLQDGAKAEEEYIKQRVKTLNAETQAQIDAINERARIESSSPSATADDLADIERERQILVSEAYEKKAAAIRELNPVYEENKVRVKEATDAALKQAEVLGSEVIKDAAEALKNYTNESDKLKKQYEEGEISIEKYNESLEESKESYRAYIDSLISTFDVSEEVAKILRELADSYDGVSDSVDKGKKSWDDFVKEFKETGWADVAKDALNALSESLGAFNDTELENTRNRLEADIDAVKNRYKVEDDILKSQLNNQLITESQFRAKQKELRKAEIAEENALEKQIFNAEKKQDRNQAALEGIEAAAQSYIEAFKNYEPATAVIVGSIGASIAAAQTAAQIGAINNRKYYDKKFAEGGMVNGPSHSEGGVPFTVQGRGGYEMEGGEYIVNKRATAMHRDLLERINKSGRTNPVQGSRKFAVGGIVGAVTGLASVYLLEEIAENVEMLAGNSIKPVRAYIADKDLRVNDNERRIRDRNDRI